MTDRKARRRRLLLGACGLCALAGCAVGFDFTGYDTSRPTPKLSSEDGGGVAPASDVAAPNQVQIAALAPLAMRRGTSATLTVTLDRNGVAGPIDLTVIDLPADVTASPATIAPSATSAAITLTADPSSDPTTSTATVHAALGGVAEGDAPLQLTVTQSRLDPTFGGSGIIVGAQNEAFQDFQLDGAENAYVGVVATPTGGGPGDFIIYELDGLGAETTALDLGGADDDYQFSLTPTGDFVVVDTDTTNVGDYAADGGALRWEAPVARLRLTSLDLLGTRVTNDGRVLVLGNASFHGGLKPDGVVIASYALDSGLADPSFGDGGSITITNDFNSVADAVLTDAGIVALIGHSDPAGPAEICVLTRVTFDGHIDPTFADGGAVIAAGDDVLGCTGVATDGNSIVALTTDFRGGSVFGLTRFTVDDGRFDPSFGDALVTNGWFAGDTASSAAIAPNGDVFIAATNSADQSAAAVLDDLADGGPNPLFGIGDGGAFPVAVAAVSSGVAVRVLKDGRVLLAGIAILEGAPTWFVARLLP